MAPTIERRWISRTVWLCFPGIPQILDRMAEADFEPLSFDVCAARAFGRVAAALRRQGRKPAARSCDAMIAAIALANGLPL